jgi:hypothetical protein
MEIKALVFGGTEVASREQRQAHGRTIQRLGRFGDDARIISMILISKLHHTIKVCNSNSIHHPAA